MTSGGPRVVHPEMCSIETHQLEKAQLEAIAGRRNLTVKSGCGNLHSLVRVVGHSYRAQ